MNGASLVLGLVLIAICLVALATGGVHKSPCPPGTFRAMDGFCTHIYPPATPHFH